MKIGQVAAQLYTVRDHLKTERDFTETIRKLKKIGFAHISVDLEGYVQGSMNKPIQE